MEHIPAEILLEIFHDYLHLREIPNDTKPTVRHSKHTFTSPILLTHVCRFWRELACSDPRLWASIYVVGPTLNQIPLVKLWLSRTGKWTLRIQFLEKYCQSVSKELTIATRELMKVFWRKKRFWDVIDFEFTNILDEYSTWMLREAMAEPDPEILVSSARIIDNRKGHKDLTLPLWRSVPWCRSLRKLEVGPMFFPTVNENLRELICHGPQTRARILGFLSCCPRLEKFEGTVTRLAGEENPWTLYPQGGLVHTELRHLCLNSFGDVASLPIYNALTCPRLEHLSAELNGGNRDCSRGMYDLIERSQCRLRTLKGVNVNFLSDSLSDMISFFSHPGLQDLETLLVYRPNHVFFQAITLPTSPSSTSNPSHYLHSLWLFPHLKNLDIVAYRANTGVEFSQMIVSRFGSLEMIRMSATPPQKILLEGPQVRNFPGIIIDVKHSLKKRETIWNDYLLFGGAWNRAIMDGPLVPTRQQSGFYPDTFGRGSEYFRADSFRVVLDGTGRITRRKRPIISSHRIY
ncbi:hypothetical protein AGABI2DRAFT_118469 [Agaricus bisporus var. bisporus H97]|uniref:hypothetical protein n=1 Tax=Agaricus bisporus var. bisporus (strain H97 / ATCC MYA-4626 / FGSC 10389) TaxID=936046 RepID=UPI00029F5DC1|nr:hypothetical protein AGABI2DRAFT_118469 [Agaricus bisporus var. bisporus H97]EKV46270.1 hypothetical protein AGABI2DRAFT_118469 [Agaricus bisporus var. bisporus H97]